MSRSLESVRWNACVHRLDLGLCSYPKEFWGEWSPNLCLLQGKNPLYRKIILVRGGWNQRRCIKQDSEPNTLPAELFRPLKLQINPVSQSQRTDTGPTSPSTDPWGRHVVHGQHVCFKSLPPVLECGFESRLGLELSGFSVWHFLKLVDRGFSPGTSFSSLSLSVNGFSQ